MMKFIIYTHSPNNCLVIYELFPDVEYVNHAKKYCTGAHIQQHTSFEDAKADCNGNKDCTCISDTGCQNNEWNIYKDATIESSHATCSWTKIGNGTPFLVPLAQNHILISTILEFRRKF